MLTGYLEIWRERILFRRKPPLETKPMASWFKSFSPMTAAQPPKRGNNPNEFQMAEWNLGEPAHLTDFFGVAIALWG
jgi:hypothetical protein